MNEIVNIVRVAVIMGVICMIFESVLPEGSQKNSLKTIIGIVFLISIAEQIVKALT
ncbi:MAG TPA: hypothetical protein GXZ61_02590 [Clostridiales bacterium]|jgi:hypothetical protein|nr:hypothetical protein [Clostridiales bacterium]